MTPSSALRAAGCERVWTDTASGRLARRPQWDACLDHLRAGDELVVTRLSRMARSVRHLTGIAADLHERGIDLVVLKQGIDTTHPGREVHLPRARRYGRDARRPDQRGHPGGAWNPPAPAAVSADAGPSSPPDRPTSPTACTPR
jgi:hypothetical protein